MSFQRNPQRAPAPGASRLPARTAAAAAGGAPRDEIRVLNPTLRDGFAQLPSPVLRARGLSDQAIRMYGLLLDYAWQDGACFPGQTRLAWDMGLKSLRSVQTILAELRAYGLIDWHRRSHKSNVYLILDYTRDPHLAVRRTEDGKPYLERVAAADDLDVSDAQVSADGDGIVAPRSDAQKTAHHRGGDAQEPMRHDGQKTADEAYPREAYSGNRYPEGPRSLGNLPEEPGRERSGPVACVGGSGRAEGDGASSPRPEEGGPLDSRSGAQQTIGGVSLRAVWSAAQDELRASLPGPSYQNWVRTAQPVGLEDGVLVIAAANSFARDWLAERLSDQIARAVARVAGAWHDVRFIVQP